jgi:S1-C subfamily serine protease
MSGPRDSGRPVLDREGQVLGIATSTFGTLAAAIATGAMPQNVNSAVRAERVAAFLAAADAATPAPARSAPPGPLSLEDVAARALASVALVECPR